MAQVVMGKLLPNLNIALDNELDHSNLIEEGEISDNDDISEIQVAENEPARKDVEIVRTWMQALHNPKVYENKDGGFITGLDLSSEVLLKKLEDRAERFGIQKKEEGPITQKEIDALYKSLDIDPENLNSCKLKNIRLDALHMRGVEEMNTNEIFKYFGEYGPASVEWINDFSCNVVWLDEATTARALLGKSQPLVIKKRDYKELDSSDSPSATAEKKTIENEAIIEMSDSEDSEVDGDDRKARDTKTESTMDVDMPLAVENSENESVKEQTHVDVPVPPGHWRLGVPHSKAKAVLLRFASKDDRKLPGAEKRSHYYQKYGNPNYGGMRGLISKSRKRKIQAERNRQVVENLTDESKEIITEANSAEITSRPVAKVNRVKMPRMRMYADDEEKRTKSGLGFSRHNSEPKSGDIRSRLGIKYTKEDLLQLGNKFSSGSEEEDDNIEINCTVPSRFNIWTDIAKSMAKEDRAMNRTEEPVDVKLSRDSRSFKSYRSSQDLRSSLDFRPASRNFESRDFRGFRGSKVRDDRRPRNRLSHDDLRSTLSSHSRTRDSLSNRSQEDLRSKIKRLKKDDSEIRKHRSPLCMDD